MLAVASEPVFVIETRTRARYGFAYALLVGSWLEVHAFV